MVMQIDIFSLGVVLWQMVTGERPDMTMNRSEMVSSMTRNEVTDEVQVIILTVRAFHS